MAIIAKYYDSIHHNKGIIESVAMRPYYGASKELGYRIKVTDSDGFMYHASCYETITEAHNKITKDFGGLELVDTMTA